MKGKRKHIDESFDFSEDRLSSIEKHRDMMKDTYLFKEDYDSFWEDIRKEEVAKSRSLVDSAKLLDKVFYRFKKYGLTYDFISAKNHMTMKYSCPKIDYFFHVQFKGSAIVAVFSLIDFIVNSVISEESKDLLFPQYIGKKVPEDFFVDYYFDKGYLTNLEESFDFDSEGKDIIQNIESSGNIYKKLVPIKEKLQDIYESITVELPGDKCNFGGKASWKSVEDSFAVAQALWILKDEFNIINHYYYDEDNDEEWLILESKGWEVGSFLVDELQENGYKELFDWLLHYAFSTWYDSPFASTGIQMDISDWVVSDKIFENGFPIDPAILQDGYSDEYFSYQVLPLTNNLSRKYPQTDLSQFVISKGDYVYGTCPIDEETHKGYVYRILKNPDASICWVYILDDVTREFIRLYPDSVRLGLPEPLPKKSLNDPFKRYRQIF